MVLESGLVSSTPVENEHIAMFSRDQYQVSPGPGIAYFTFRDLIRRGCSSVHKLPEGTRSPDRSSNSDLSDWRVGDGGADLHTIASFQALQASVNLVIRPPQPP